MIPRLDPPVPLLQVFDMSASLAFYRDALGFRVVQQTDHEWWAMLRLGEADLMLNTAYEEGERPPGPDPARVRGHKDVSLYGIVVRDMCRPFGLVPAGNDAVRVHKRHSTEHRQPHTGIVAVIRIGPPIAIPVGFQKEGTPVFQNLAPPGLSTRVCVRERMTKTPSQSTRFSSFLGTARAGEPRGRSAAVATTHRERHPFSRRSRCAAPSA